MIEQTTRARRASQVLMALALLLMIGHFAIYVHYAIELVRFPFDYDQGEGFELVDTILFSQGEWPYRNNEVYPFYASNYPPLFHVILVPFVWIFGEAYWYGRLAGFVGTLITAGTIGFVVHREERHRSAAILAGLAYLASNIVYHVGPLFRQHMTMVMFEVLAVAVLAHANETNDTRQRRRALITGLGFLLAAGFTKQLALATCVAVFAFLLIRNPRRGLIWGILFSGVAGILFLWINISTGGEWWKNIIAANVNDYYPAQFVNLFKQWWGLHRALAVLAAAFALYEIYFTRLSIYSIWWVLALANTVLSGKWGAGDSYFATAIAATCLLAGLFTARTLRGAWTFPELPLTRPFRGFQAWAAAQRQPISIITGLALPVFWIVYGLSVVKMPTEGAVFGPLSDALGLESSYYDQYPFYDAAGWTEGYATIGYAPTQADIDNGWRIVGRLRASDKPAMSEEAGFNLRADKDVITNPTQLKNLYENDLFDPTELARSIREHEFGLIIFRAQFYPPPVLEAAYEAYYPAEVIPMNRFNYEIWEPGPPQDERAALALSLESFTPESETAQTLSLPLVAARAWLAHALAYHNWEPASEMAEIDGCLTRAYRKGQVSLSAELCAVGDETALILTGDAN